MLDLVGLQRALLVLEHGSFHKAAEALGVRPSVISLVLAPDEDALIRTPRGFESVQAGDLLDLLRCRSFVVRSPLARKSLAGSGLSMVLADFAEAAMPLLRFGWGAR